MNKQPNKNTGNNGIVMPGSEDPPTQSADTKSSD